MGYISYEKLIKAMEDHGGLSYYGVRRSGIIGQDTLGAIRCGRSGVSRGSKAKSSFSTQTLATLCGVLRKQPGDLLEYVEDADENPKE